MDNSSINRCRWIRPYTSNFYINVRESKRFEYIFIICIWLHEKKYFKIMYLDTFGSSTFLIISSNGIGFLDNFSKPPKSSTPPSKIWSKRYCKIFCTTKFEGLSLRKVFHGYKNTTTKEKYGISDGCLIILRSKPGPFLLDPGLIFWECSKRHDPGFKA